MNGQNGFPADPINSDGVVDRATPLLGGPDSKYGADMGDDLLS